MYKVFLVEDERIIRAGLKDLIHRVNPRFQVVQEADGGDLAVHLLQHFEPDVLITDIKMPGKDGLEVISYALSKYPQLPCVIISGYEEFELAQRAIKIGSMDYLLKPVDKEQLSAAFTKVEQKIQSTLLNQSVISMLNIEPEFRDVIEGDPACLEDFIIKLHSNFPHLTGESAKVMLFLNKTQPFESVIDYVLRKISGIVFYTKDNLYVVICNLPDEFIDSKTLYLQGIYNDLRSLYRRRIKAICSDAFYTWKHIRQIYLKMLEQFNLQYYVSIHSIGQGWIEASENRFKDLTESEEREQMDSMLFSIETSNMPELHKRIDLLFSQFKQNKVPKTTIHRMTSRMLRRTMNRFNSVQLTSIGLAETIPMQWVQSFQCIDDLHRELKSNLSKLIGLRLSDGSTSGVITSVQAIVDKEFSQPQLSIALIARRIYLNPSYLSVLFKKESGKTFSQYLMDVRLNHARKLLHDPNLMTYEIAGLTGYQNEKAFSRAFKRKFGMSPREYRKNCRGIGIVL